MSVRSEPVHASGERTDSFEGRTVGAGRFEVRGELGRGGMAEVYRAFDRHRRREVALKVIAARYVGRSDRERRFRNEADYAQRVGAHCNVLSVVDVGDLADCGGRLFMTMDAVEGPTLAMELASSRRLPVGRAVTWARQIADGLRAIHAAGVVHRDLTPSNVLIEAGTDIVKIFDFGLAGEVDAPASGHPSRLTLLGEVPGTHGYMAPEQAVLAPPAMSMDVHAFGVVVTEMLVGHNPFAHLDRAEYIEWQQSSREEAPSIKRWGLALPEGLAELIDDCLRRDPKKRPQSGAELLARLDRIGPTPSVVSEPTPAAVVDMPVLATVAPIEDDAEDDTDTIRGEPPETPKPRPWVVWAVLASLLVVTGVAVGWWLRATAQDDAPAVTPQPTLPDRHDAVEGTTSSSVMPVLAPAVEPRPSDAPVASGGGERAPAPTTSPETDPVSADPPGAASSAVSCETRRKRAHDAAQRRLWKKVLASTSSGRCWPEERERKRLRVRALAETGQHAACVRLAADSGDQEIVKWRLRCEQGLWKPAP